MSVVLYIVIFQNFRLRQAIRWLFFEKFACAAAGSNIVIANLFNLLFYCNINKITLVVQCVLEAPCWNHSQRLSLFMQPASRAPL